MQHLKRGGSGKRQELRRMDSVVHPDATLTPMRRFGQMTSMKGISRAVRTPSPYMRAMWLVAGMVGIGMTLLQLQTLTRMYLAYGTVAQTTIDYGTEPPFPDVSICPLHALNAEKVGTASLTLEQYMGLVQSIREKMSKDGLDIQDADHQEELWNELISLSGYLSNYDADAFERAEKMLLGELIQDCKWFNWQWSELKGERCMLASRTYFYSPEYFLCHTISLQDLREDNVRGLAIIVYVEESNQFHMPSFHPSLTKSVAKGIRVKVHPPKTLPDMKTGISVSPGTETTFHLKPIKRVLLGNPYSDCIDIGNFSSLFDAPGTYPSEWAFMGENYTRGDFLQYRYSTELCVSMCRQHWVMQNCSCLSPHWLILREMGRIGLGVCGKINFNNCSLQDHESCLSETDAVKETLKSLRCSTLAETSEDCRRTCIAPCEEVHYKPDVTKATWPHESYQLAFYEKYIQNTTLEGKFWQYGEVLHMKAAGNHSAAERALHEIDLLGEHFLQLNFYIDERSMTEVRDTPATTVTTLLANLGGIMNLWAGITFYTLFELIELVFYLFTNAGTRRRTPLPEGTKVDNVELRGIY